MNIRPLQDRVIVKRLEEEQKTKEALLSPTRQKRSLLKVKLSPLAKAR